VTVLKLPQDNEAGAVHIALREGWADADIPLPAALQNWLQAAGASLRLQGAPDGVALSPQRDAIRLTDSALRRFPLQWTLQSGEQRVSFWIVQRP
jgi:hypothetical protein